MAKPFCFVLFFIGLFTLSTPFSVSAQRCDYKASTSSDLVKALSLGCANPAIYQVFICLDGGTVFSNTSYVRGPSCIKAFVLTAPGDNPATLRFPQIFWNSSPLELVNIIVDLAITTYQYNSQGSAFFVQSVSSAYTDFATLSLSNVSIINFPAAYRTYSYSVFNIHFSSSFAEPATIMASGLSLKQQTTPTIFYLSGVSNPHLTLDGIQISDSTIGGYFAYVQYGSVFSLTNSEFINLQGQQSLFYIYDLYSTPGIAVQNNRFSNISALSGILIVSVSSYSPSASSILLQENQIVGSSLPTSAYSSSASDGLFRFPNLPITVTKNNMIDNFVLYNATLKISAPLVSFLSTIGTITASNNTVKPPIVCFRGWTPSSNLISCIPCAAGSISQGTVCTLCDAGTYNPTSGASSCLSCGAGYSSKSGAAFCSACLPGTFSAAPAASQCYPCPANTYQNLSAQQLCHPCPPNTCSPSGSTSCHTC